MMVVPRLLHNPCSFTYIFVSTQCSYSIFQLRPAIPNCPLFTVTLTTNYGNVNDTAQACYSLRSSLSREFFEMAESAFLNPDCVGPSRGIAWEPLGFRLM